MRAAIPNVLRRLAAYAIDVAILAVVLIPLSFGVQAMIGYRAETGIGVWLASLLLISLPSWAYFILFDASSSGATLGKRVVGLRAARVEGSPLGLRRAVLRTAVKLLPWELTHLTMFALSPELGTFSGLQLGLLWAVYALLALYLFVALRHEGRRSVHDLAAGAAVLSGRA
jgi:uncharacterized RDD family membrane protein YckC